MSGAAGLRAPASVRWVLLVAGLIGLSAALMLSIEKYLLLTNPFYVTTCDLGSTLNCQDIMDSWQASVFGFPNPFIGLMGFAIVTAIGAGSLAGAAFRRWFWLGLLAGCVLAGIFVLWLMWQSVFAIGALCPYCMVVWVVVGVLLTQVPRVFAQQGSGPLAALGAWLNRWHLPVAAAWLLVIAAAALIA